MCDYPQCGRNYYEKGSLVKHFKDKHNGRSFAEMQGNSVGFRQNKDQIAELQTGGTSNWQEDTDISQGSIVPTESHPMASGNQTPSYQTKEEPYFHTSSTTTKWSVVENNVNSSMKNDCSTQQMKEIQMNVGKDGMEKMEEGKEDRSTENCRRNTDNDMEDFGTPDFSDLI